MEISTRKMILQLLGGQHYCAFKNSVPILIFFHKNAAEKGEKIVLL